MVVKTIKVKVLRFVRIILDFVAFIIGLRHPSKQRYLPPIDDRLLLQSAISIADNVRKGKVKSEDVVRAYIARIISVNPHLNAVIQDCFARAINEAIQIDKRVQTELSGNGPNNETSILSLPLLGVPFTAKDLVAIKNMYLTAGLYDRKGITADEDCEVIVNMIKAGAIPICLTNVPELAMWWDGYNKLYGRTFNPYDKSRITGGSSSGEAALISSAGSIIGVGADIGGSIRMPCHFCGIFGHKTTPGIVSAKGFYPQVTPKRLKLQSVGPMCRYASDLKPMLKAMAGESAKKLKLDQKVDIKKLKVYYMEAIDNPLISPVHEDISDSMKRVIKYFEANGNTVNKVYFKHAKHGFVMWLCAIDDTSAPKLSEELTNLKGKINPFIELIKCIFGLSNYTVCLVLSCFSDYISEYIPMARDALTLRFEKIQNQMTNELHTLLGDDGILLFPTHPEPAPKHNGTFLKLLNISYTNLFNTLFVAITQVPLGLSRDGLPIGLQIVASPYNDHLTIGVAEEIEKQFGGWKPPCELNC